ncbi:V-type proton ATPase subunit S1b [Engraulis encrasicolus]|uniref:V-type proton ATPase subunit S1b n=1 Tax=Engraulis encrasicolus TaxID=184585 RepID=UPI002FD35CA3
MEEVSTSKKSFLNMTVFRLLIALLLTNFCYCQVPLVMWTDEGNALPSLDPPTAGQMMSVTQVKSYLSSALSTAPHTVLLFQQDKLSIDDFTVYGGVFGNKEDGAFPSLQAHLRKASAPLVLPSIDMGVASELAALLQEVLGTPPLHTDPSSLDGLASQLTDPALLVIRLPYGKGILIKDVLHQNDVIIGKALQIVQEANVPYTAIYTGLQPSRVIADPSPMGAQLVGRSLLQSPTPSPVKPPVVFNGTQGPCILLWADALNVSFERQPNQWDSVDLAPFTFSPTVSLAGSSCSENSSLLVLNYNSVLNFTSLSLTFSMTKRFSSVSARNWSLVEQVRVAYDGQVATFNGSREIYSPAEYSYHCQMVSSTTDPLLVAFNVTDNARSWRILFTDFQIQGFNVTGDFSYASDCASFFTGGIWMGLITTLLMLLILTYGVHMLTQLRTMDRFEDPKGPGISVPLSE